VTASGPDSDALIRHYATKNGVGARSLPALAFYTETIFPQILDSHEQKSGGETRHNR
jgi:hypothetical protein